MWIFLASLAMLFAGCLVGFLVIRVRAPEWPPAGSPELPAAFWISTALLVVVSALLAVAENGVAADRTERLARLLGAAAAVAVGFVLSQVSGWASLAGNAELPQDNLFLFGVYVLSFLHLLHVLGGLVPLVWVAIRSARGRYSAADYEGITGTAMYWHFLGAVWIGILAVLLI